MRIKCAGYYRELAGQAGLLTLSHEAYGDPHRGPFYKTAISYYSSTFYFIGSDLSVTMLYACVENCNYINIFFFKCQVAHHGYALIPNVLF